MYSALKLTKWLGAWDAAQLELDPQYEPMTTAKAMKLLYFCQVAYLGLYDKKFFKEDIIAERSGPVIKEVENEYGRRGLIHGSLDDEYLKDYREIEKDPKAAMILSSICKIFGRSSTLDIFHYIKQGQPWKLTHLGNVFKEDLLKEYCVDVFEFEETDD